MRKAAPLPEGAQKARAVRGMFDAIAGRYDLVNRIMTFGLDVGWRRRAVRSLDLPAGSVVLDLACGTGDFCREISKRGKRAIGFDFSYGMLAAARTSVPLVQADILSLPIGDARADGVTCGFALRNVVDLTALFAEIARVVRPGGRIALLEVSQPDNKVMRAGHRFYFNKVVPRIGGLISDRKAYSYLPASVAYLPPEDELLLMISAAGFDDVEQIRLGGGAAQIVLGTRA
jgi:demethylmenaquinone methyltransferase/2-methoxy-6-polyprenyl-1,4-benzoquinol methylase